jgi:hypothetical protein
MSCWPLHDLMKDSPADLHDIGHNDFLGSLPTQDQNIPYVLMDPTRSPSGRSTSYYMALCHAWHVEHYAYLIDKCRSTPEGAGTLLDNCALQFVFSGGHGPGTDNSTDKGIGAHSTHNMASMLAGRVGGLKPGKHIASQGQHPALVATSALKAVGLPDQMGEVTGHLPELFT